MNLHSKPEGDEEQSRRQLAAAYSFLNELPDTAFESLLAGDIILPPDYEKAVQDYSSKPIQERIAAWRHNVSLHPVSDKPNVGQQFGEACEQVAIGLKHLLSEFGLESFAAAHLGNDVTETKDEVLRIIPLVDRPELCQQLPWLGDMLRIYQHERHSGEGTANYVAFVETVEVEPNQQHGELRVILTSNDCEQAEILLSFDFPSCEFPIRLPADESQVTLECYADNAA